MHTANRAPRLSLEKEQAGVLLGRVGSFFLVGVNVVENGFSGQRPLLQTVDDLHGLAGVDVAVKGQPQISQGLAAPVAVIHGKQQAAIVSKGGIVYDRLNGGIDCKFCLHGSTFFLPRAGRCGRLRSAPGEEQGQRKGADCYEMLYHWDTFFLPEQRRRPFPP